MYSSQTAAQGPRSIVGNALRGAGLIDRDTQMRDATDKPGGRKGISKMRSHRPRAGDAYKDVGPSKSMLVNRISALHAGPSDPLSIRGAARPTVVGRMRRNAVSGSDAESSSSTPRTRVTIKGDDPWRELIQSRWDPQTRFLNLESMLDSEVVKKHNLTPPGHGGNIRQADTIFRIASQLKPGVKTLSLANNAFNGALLSHIDKYLPRLANLSLANNQLRVWSDLDVISSRKGKLKHLRELILTGNPIREMEFQHGRGEQYKADISRRFPGLEVLDQEPIVSISFDVDGPSSTPTPAIANMPAATTFPAPMSGSFITGVDGAVVGNFLVRFFNLFDNQRNGLVDVYDPAATFSFCANTSIPNRARIEGLHNTLPNQHNLTWTPWITDEGTGSSRNLSRIGGGLEKTIKSLHIGPEDILKTLTNLPGTNHEIDGPPEKFCVDAFPIPHGAGMGLLLVIHGQFTEVATKGLRSFDRTFVLVPAPPGSRAQINGWGVVILSDEWTIRAYSNFDVWKAGPMVVQPSYSQAPAPPQPQVQPQPQPPPQPTLQLPADQQAALAAIPDPQRSLVVQICMRTGLNVNYAVQCLEGNGWQLEQAFANFLEVKANLPGDAFLNPLVRVG